MTTILANPLSIQQLMRRLERNIRKKPVLLLQILLGLSNDSTFQRIMFCPQYPLKVGDALEDETRNLQMFLEEHPEKTPGVLWSLFESSKSKKARRKLGQFITSPNVAKIAVSNLKVSEGQLVLDPGCGSAAFGVALLHGIRSFADRVTYLGIEDDPALALAGSLALQIAGAPPHWRIVYSNFLRLDPEYLSHIGIKRADRIICNPPFVRHHMLEGITQVTSRISTRSDLRLSGFSGLHSHFLAQSVSVLSNLGRMVFLFPLGMNEVDYGHDLLKQLGTRFKVTRVGHYGDMTMFSFETNPQTAKTALPASKPRNEIHLEDFANVHRGISTGCNDFFVLTQSEVDKYSIPEKFLRKVVPTKIRMNYLRFTLDDWNNFRKLGKPCWMLAIPEKIQRTDLPRGLLHYIELGEEKELHKIRTCAIRKSWYSIRWNTESIPQFFFTYMFRGYPRFVYNPDKLWNLTNLLGVSLISSPQIQSQYYHNTMARLAELLNEDVEIMMRRGVLGRRYGGGLLKFEPGDLDLMPLSKNTKSLVEEIGTGAYGSLF